jgi:serine/threonine-protein kinase
VPVPRAHLGPETVINPERRTIPVPTGGSVLSGSSVKSSVVRVLFPSDDDGRTQTFDAEAGVQLGHFAIIERIRSGGMGAVFRALDTRLARVVALKILPPALSREPSIVQRFKNEGQAAAQLDHENVARVYYIGEEHGLHFIAYEFIHGTNVRDLIAQQGRLSVAEAVNYILQIASALVHTSAQGIVHRDIKPSNIIITPSGRAKLVDLGLARKESKDEQGADLTVAGTTLGTFDYISPEQARDPRAADVRSDIYSLGCTLYHMLTGEPPYPEGTVLQKLLQHQGDEAPDPALKNRLVPENVSAVVRKMMAKDPRRRYHTPEQLVRDLMLVAGSLGLRSVSPEGLVWLAAQPQRTSFVERHLAWIVTAALLLAIVAYLEFAGVGAPAANDRSQSPRTKGDRALTRANPEVGPGRTGSRESAGPDGAAAAEMPVASTVSDRQRRPADRSSPKASRADLVEAEDDAAADESPPKSIVPVLLPGAKRLAAAEDPSESLFPTAAAGPTSSKAVLAASDLNSRNTVSASQIPPVDGQSESESTGETNSGRPARIERAIPSGRSEGASEEDVFFVLGRDGGADRGYSSLEAACSSIRTDGAEIQLRFNGLRREAGIRINRKVTIRAARGYRPLIEFRPSEVVSEEYQARAIWIPSGSLELVGVDLVLVVDDAVSADQWSLFSLEHADALRLEGVTVTLANPRQRSAAAFELRPGAAAGMPDMPVPGAQPKFPLEIDIADSLVRGEGNLFFVRHTEPARLAVKQSVVALAGSLLAARGASEAAHENAQLELRLDHVTSVLAGGLVRLDSGSTSRRLLPLQVSASNSIFSNLGSQALVTMTGNSPPQDFRTLLSWLGRSNFYDRYQIFWLIDSTEAMTRSEASDFSGWRKTEASETNARLLDATAWSRRNWTNRPFSELTLTDFALERNANNPALGGATDFADAGADLEKLPKPPALVDK